MSDSDLMEGGVIVHKGKAVHFITVENSYGIRSCTQCIGSINNEVCDELPDTCRTHEVHFEEPDE